MNGNGKEYRNGSGFANSVMAKKKRVLSHRAQLNRYFERGILMTLFLCGTDKKRSLKNLHGFRFAIEYKRPKC